MMSFETTQKLKKVFIFLILGVLALITILSFLPIYFSIHQQRLANSEFGMMQSPLSEDLGKSISRDSFSGFMMGDTTPTSEVDINPVPGFSNTPIVERKLTQDGNLSLVVVKVEDSVFALSGISEKLGGRVDSVDYRNVEGYEKKVATVVFRVPAVNFSKAMLETKAIGLKVVSENVSTRDVTEQFVDMQARLKTLKATEEQYLQVMLKAVRVEDILSVSKYLSEVRTEIEQIQGQMNYLSRQVDMSVITVQLSSEPEINPTGEIWNPGTTAKDSMRDFIQTFYSFCNILIKIVLYYLPILILLGGVVFLIFLLYVKVLRPWYGASRDLFHF